MDTATVPCIILFTVKSLCVGVTFVGVKNGLFSSIQLQHSLYFNTCTMAKNLQLTLIFFPAEVEYSYFSADFKLKISL